jgi:hypothetical protein
LLNGVVAFFPGGFFRKPDLRKLHSATARHLLTDNRLQVLDYASDVKQKKRLTVCANVTNVNKTRPLKRGVLKL